MSKKSSNLLNSIFTSSGILKTCAQKIQVLDELNKIVQKALNPELKAHCRVANIKKNTVILTTTSPIWKYQLHFWQYEILQAIQHHPHFKHIKAIKTKITPHDYNKLERKVFKHDLKPPSISSTNAEILSDMADGIGSKKLANALRNISKHANKQQSGKNKTQLKMQAEEREYKKQHGYDTQNKLQNEMQNFRSQDLRRQNSSIQSLEEKQHNFKKYRKYQEEQKLGDFHEIYKDEDFF